jgi:hypothetical protein
MTASTTQDPKANGHDKPKFTPMPITVTHPEKVEVAKLRLFREPAWVLRLTIEEDRSYLKVKVVRAAPLSHPDGYISFLDGKDEEICMVDELKELDPQTSKVVTEELDRRYLTAMVESIHSVRNEFGTSYWDVATSRGRREFVVQNVAENAQWLGGRRLLLVDVDGNRFEIPDLDLLDKRSQGLVDEVL